MMPLVVTAFFFLALAAQFASAAPATNADERELAEWVLRWEGTVLLEGGRQPLTDVSQLPAG
ncbi:MAG TPA: hypothetical protein VNH18_19755, partial [Bryobacteraceae bacterium]|nr:hypothetical protein [Bryobacteraceae bacterium]